MQRDRISGGRRRIAFGAMAVAAMVACGLAVPSGPAAAQSAAGSAAAGTSAGDYPSHPIRFIVPFPPGSGTDTSARYFGKKISEMTGQPVVIENRAGGNGFIAVQQVLSAPADGYTIFIGSNSTLSTNAALFKKLPYDPVADFAPISTLVKGPALLIVPPDSPYKTLAEFIDAARKQPGKLNYGAGSAGYQLMGELFAESTGTKLLHVPYKGASDAVTAVAAGNVDFSPVDISAAVELARSGKVRALAVAADQRSSALPDVPTAGEAGASGYTAYTWVAAMAPAHTPKPVVDKLTELFVAIVGQPETRDFYVRQGQEVAPAGPDYLRKFQRDEIALWKRIAEVAKVPLQ
ncbi:MAG: tripartite tricarboxylate transporter substrate binding protein [Burkholderiaceae bacterium]